VLAAPCVVVSACSTPVTSPYLHTTHVEQQWT